MAVEAANDRDASSAASADPSEFHPNNRTETVPDVQSLGEVWLTVLDSKCTFGPDAFDRVMLNLIKNPNITSSHLFRADILYDSSKDSQAFTEAHSGEHLGKHLKPEYKPKLLNISEWQLVKVLVRQLVPRNPQLDRPLIQTCTYLSRCDDRGSTDTLVVYIPHINSADEMPFYHPRVEKLAFYHSFQPRPSPLGPGSSEGKVSVSYKPFPEPNSEDINNKLDRTALKLLQTVHKHGQGQLAGYEKRVHHDQVIPQQQYQDTYTRLKTKYGRKLSEQWVETTDPSKHVFEDLGIAAFLLELWAEMFEKPVAASSSIYSNGATNAGAETNEASDELPSVSGHSNVDDTSRSENHGGVSVKPPFPGFVDIGCGNGLLVNILISEGYPGFGFDARERKTWSTFPADVRKHLHQRILVPEVIRSVVDDESSHGQTWHDGVFPEDTFVISNHADELTAWTPLLAYLNNSAFIAIPCCSHDLTGSRFRAPEYTKALKPDKRADSEAPLQHPARLPQQQAQDNDGSGIDTEESGGKPTNLHMTQAAETGSLKRTLVQKKMASAYSTLCSYVTSLAMTVGFEPEQEVLRIPSTRNQSIIGRRKEKSPESYAARKDRIRQLVEEELNKGVDRIGKEWVVRAEQLARKPGSGH